MSLSEKDDMSIDNSIGYLYSIQSLLNCVETGCASASDREALVVLANELTGKIILEISHIGRDTAPEDTQHTPCIVSESDTNAAEQEKRKTGGVLDTLESVSALLNLISAPLDAIDNDGVHLRGLCSSVSTVPDIVDSLAQDLQAHCCIVDDYRRKMEDSITAVIQTLKENGVVAF